jgi:hypothetical protein
MLKYSLASQTTRLISQRKKAVNSKNDLGHAFFISIYKKSIMFIYIYYSLLLSKNECYFQAVPYNYKSAPAS